ncbi:probable LRR receptor-like serine/threonine-protein kinase RKF3 [Impatiens glandulifera]|uniref:probable LRR receptor-like serine/threonine-protein kinase RKF3 n=1 Tax=Impatiens glandulifera TaxID=253017 RepID=UPI001FB09652|nr:probable LRR receptor-like serine/threonine-protein kinase RKF3 [Impatiens glandulifera]
MSVFFFLLFLSLNLGFQSQSISSASTIRRLLQNQTTNTTTTCPLDFESLRRRIQSSNRPNLDVATRCHYVLQGIRLVQSEYLRSTGNFVPPLDSADACWNSYQTLVNDFVSGFDIRKTCGFQTSWIAEGCMNITTRREFESNVSSTALNNVAVACNQSLENSSPCASCTTTLSSLQATYLAGNSIGNVSDCTAYPLIYAAAVNQFGPADSGTAKCLFSLESIQIKPSNKNRKTIIAVAVVSISFLILFLGLSGLWYFRRKRLELLKKRRISRRESELASGLESINSSTTLVNYTFDQIKTATKKFSRDNIIGKGGYGNVYKGILPDNTEIAVKRFKNCSVSGDAIFAHEVQVIASVRHVNLVALRGYCTATTPMEGHQRILVTDLVKNGSLHDHLFGTTKNNLSWPIRQKIALGTARGLLYLHQGAQPAIIHRDIKASNILLDEAFEPKVADFGLAKFTPEGMTHLSTRVAGTMGYVAPEYALYGQLTERSDVYSFGVVFLELLSGKKALMAVEDGQNMLITDWAWSLVRDGRALDVIEDGMSDLGNAEVMEKYVLIAVLCSHPQLYARPTMDQVVKMFDTDLAVPSIPDRPIPIIANIDDIERSVGSSGSISGNLSGSGGFHCYYVQDEDDH